MLSRVADSLYWMSRYLERAEHIARLLEVNLTLMLDEASAGAELRWQRVLNALGHPQAASWSGEGYALARLLTSNLDEASSIVSCIAAARENARQVREQISSEQWEQLNSLYHDVMHPGLSGTVDVQLSEYLPSVVHRMHLFQGVTDSTMSHGEGWHFIQVGRYLERASAGATLLDVYCNEFFTSLNYAYESTEFLEWIGLLRCCTAFEAFCKVYTADITPERVLEFLLLNEQFPHSVRFSVDCLQAALESIDGASGKRRALPLTRIAGRLQASLCFGQIGEVVEAGVGSYLRGILRQCLTVHQMIYQLYIHYAIETALAG